MFDKAFEIKIDASKCTSLVEGGAFWDGKKVYASWRFKDIKLEFGKIYGIVGECIYTNREYDITELQKFYTERFDREECIK